MQRGCTVASSYLVRFKSYVEFRVISRFSRMILREEGDYRAHYVSRFRDLLKSRAIKPFLMFCKVYLQYVINYHRVVIQQGPLVIRLTRTVKDKMGIRQNKSLTTLSFIELIPIAYFSKYAERGHVTLQIDPYLV